MIRRAASGDSGRPTRRPIGAIVDMAPRPAPVRQRPPAFRTGSSTSRTRAWLPRGGVLGGDSGPCISPCTNPRRSSRCSGPRSPLESMRCGPALVCGAIYACPLPSARSSSSLRGAFSLPDPHFARRRVSAPLTRAERRGLFTPADRRKVPRNQGYARLETAQTLRHQHAAPGRGATERTRSSCCPRRGGVQWFSRSPTFS